MREHKYRAFDLKNKVMYQEAYLADRGHVKAYLIEDDPLCSNFEESRVHLLEFTGLKDKNGKKIYEGDILSGKFASGYGGKSTRYKEFNAQVKYSAPEFTIIFHGDYSYRFYPQWDECEVIGNIYENPELLDT